MSVVATAELLLVVAYSWRDGWLGRIDLEQLRVSHLLMGITP